MNKNTKNRTGEKYITYQSYIIEIIEYFSNRDVTIQFEDGLILKNKVYSDIKNGKIKNPFHPTINGKGFYGIGKYTANDKSYYIWKSMLNRCYDKKRQKSHFSYKNVRVCEEWHNFQNFAKWYEENWKSEHMNSSWHLDKDILIKGNKVYSPETCCFVPSEINSLFTKNNVRRGDLPIGVQKAFSKFVVYISKGNIRTYLGIFDTAEEAFQAYKTAKEQYIKEIADKWKYQISPKVYEVMCNYIVEITD